MDKELASYVFWKTEENVILFIFVYLIIICIEIRNFLVFSQEYYAILFDSYPLSYWKYFNFYT